MKHGPEDLRDAVERATPYPLSGLNSADHYDDEVDRLYREGVVKGETTGFPSVDEIYTV